MHECCLDYLTQQLPSWFYISFTSLDSRYIIRQIIILIVSRSCMFSQDYDLVLHWVSCVTYITSLQGSYLIVLCLNLALKTLILILNNLYWLSQSCRSPLIRTSTAYYSSMTYWCSFCGSLILSLRPQRMMSFNTHFLSSFLSVAAVDNCIYHNIDWQKLIRLTLLILRSRPTQSSTLGCFKALVLWVFHIH